MLLFGSLNPVVEIVDMAFADVVTRLPRNNSFTSAQVFFKELHTYRISKQAKDDSHLGRPARRRRRCLHLVRRFAPVCRTSSKCGSDSLYVGKAAVGPDEHGNDQYNRTLNT
jgi:hypothetical protein